MDEQRELDEFISLISHELRTPLTAIKGYAQLVLRQRRNELDDSIAESLRTIVEQSDRLDQMTAALLDISRVRVGRVPLRLERMNLVAAAQLALAPHASAGDEILADPPSTGVYVTADAARMSQIIATVVRYLTGRPGSGAIAARVEPDPGVARLEIWDDGEALDPECTAEMFTRLIEPATNRPTGWKIARPELYVARGLAAAHGGSLVAESPIGKSARGVKFVLTLPLDRG